MIIPDINLLIYAYNGRDPQYPQAREWWEACMRGTRPIGIPWISVSGFIRISTNPRAMPSPLRVEEAVARVRRWLSQPQVRLIQPGSRFQELFLGYLEQLGTGGSLTTDAQLAALAVEHQAELHSNDADFSRFSGLKWVNPLKS